jgi:hypothetical protein
MSTASLRTKLKSKAESYNSAQANIPSKLKQEKREFTLYSPEAQAAAILEARTRVRTETKVQLEALSKEILEEKKSLPLSIGKEKFPNLLSKELQHRAIGESQILSARLFLASNPAPLPLVAEIRNAFSLGRTDYAWTLIDSVRTTLPKNGELPAPTDQQKWLEAELLTLANEFEGSAKLAELEKEAETLKTVADMIGEFQQQIDRGAEYVILPGLFPDMSVEERTTAMQHIDGIGSTVEMVSLKRRVAEAMH